MSEEKVEIVRSICTPWASGDFRSIEWADDDIEFVREDKIARKGVNAMVSQWVDWLASWEEFASVPDDFIDAGDHVLVMVTFRGRGKGSGTPIQDFPGACLFTLRENKVVRLVLFTDIKEALEAAGLSE